jgi:hypothetical protein
VPGQVAAQTKFCGLQGTGNEAQGIVGHLQDLREENEGMGWP